MSAEAEGNWFGELPDGWEILNLRHLGDVLLGLTYSPGDVSESNEGTLVIRASNVQGGKLVHADDVFVDSEVPTKIQTQKGDLIICSRNGSRRLIGKSAQVTDEWIGQTFGAFMTAIRSPYSDWIKWVLSSAIFEFQSSRFMTSTINQLTTSTLKSFPVPVAPLETQRRIVAYLDEKTARIDGLIEKKRALLERLAEKRQALITRAVTKGLNPDAPMKPSGIDWLGDIPAHWEVMNLRYGVKNLNNMRVPIAAELRKGIERTFPYYGASGIIDYVDEFIFDFPTVLVAEDGANLLSRSTPLAFAADGKYWVNNHAHILKPLRMTIWFCSSLLALYPLDPWISGSAQPKLTKENLGALPIWVPSIEEQELIEASVSKATAQISAARIPLEKSIKALEEYRAAIITSAVTGKIEALL